MSKRTVWYDAGCPLCRREIALMRRLDRHGRIHFVDASDAATICPVDRTQILSQFHVLENGQLLTGAAAFAAMWRVIPLLSPLGIMAKLPGALPVLDLAYRQFLRVRPQLQRLMK